MWRMEYVMSVLHPLSRVAAYRWDEGGGGIEAFRRPPGAEHAHAYDDNPVRHVFQGAGEIRHHLEAGGAGANFPALAALAAAGATDTIAFPVVFSDGRINAVAFTSRRAGGFAARDLDGLRSAVQMLCPLLEVQQARDLTATLLDTYVGRRAGPGVLSGAIARGGVETFRAAMWHCDLHGFARLAREGAAKDAVAALNDFFAAIASGLDSAGGEILGYEGDAMIAAFPVGDAGEADVCSRAHTAALAARDAVAALNEERGGLAELGFSLALHVGEVHYANVGVPGRLSFTAFGQATDFAARLQRIARTAGRTIVASQAFADSTGGDDFEPLGDYDIKGFESPQPVFGAG